MKLIKTYIKQIKDYIKPIKTYKKYIKTDIKHIKTFCLSVRQSASKGSVVYKLFPSSREELQGGRV